MNRKFQLLLCVLLLTACSSNKKFDPVQGPIKTPTSTVSNEPELSGEGCLLPLTKLAFPFGETNILPSAQKPLLPGNDWSFSSTVPDRVDGEELSLELGGLDRNHGELWMLSSLGRTLIYQIDRKEWIVIPPKSNSPMAMGSSLFLDKAGGVWSIRRWSVVNTPLLAHYDTSNQSFKSVDTAEKSFAKNNKSLSIYDIKVDTNGVFWMVILERDSTNLKENYYLYSFDPESSNLKLHLNGVDFALPPSLALGKSGSIFLLNISLGKLIEYLPESKQVHELEIPNPEIKNKLSAVLFWDSSNHLWVDDLGWFDFSLSETAPQWFNVVRSPVLIDVVQGAGVWSWQVPIFTYEKPNGLLWFNSSRGTGWLDTAKGKWCIFTSYPSNVIEDTSKNLWLLANGDLYTHKP